MVTYRHRTRNAKKGVLSQKGEYCELDQQVPSMILKPSNFILSTTVHNLLPSMRSLLPNDPFTIQIYEALDNATTQIAFLYHKGHIYIPNGSPRLQVLQISHDPLLAGHFGQFNTQALKEFLVAGPAHFNSNLYLVL